MAVRAGECVKWLVGLSSCHRVSSLYVGRGGRGIAVSVDVGAGKSV